MKAKYFVLKPESKFKGDPYAKASREAMKIYATVIQDENPRLANDIDDWLTEEFLWDDGLSDL